MNREKGSALITIILVVFVLTMVGIAGVLFMTMEDRLSGNDKLQQAALYASEDGLRQAESLVSDAASNSSTALNQMLSPVTTNPSLVPPGGGYAAVPLVLNGTSYYNVAVPQPSGVSGQATYSLYVRNNEDDPAPATATKDTDQKINIIAVGTVSDPSGKGITKILEEQMFLGGAGGGERLMKGANLGGTGAAGIK